MNNNLNDTIAAISTPIGSGGIAIIRISGEDAFKIISKIFVYNKKEKNSEQIKSHTINYGVLKDKNGEIVDEVLVSFMKAPNTYTKENTAEINCHGGIRAANRVLSLVIENGARMAQPGEFTKRAFLNGRIDLSQAEAVMDIINAKTQLAHKSALERLNGRLSSKVKLLRDEILTMTAHIEAAIDYPEHDDEMMTYEMIKNKSLKLLEDIKLLLKYADTGKIIRQGVNTVILGKPNVGKSSLLNALIEEDRAIVTDIPGTTRDVLQESININGIALNIIDTAGIRSTTDAIEKMGVEKSKQYAKNSDLVLFVLDGSQSLDDDDIKILEFVKDKNLIIIINKIDLTENTDFDKVYNYADDDYIIKMSVKNEIGFEKLFKAIEKLFTSGKININEEALITNERNKASVADAARSLENVVETIENMLPEDFISMDLIQAYKSLGEITGDSVEEDIIDKIFSEFCLGK